jgi:hypothetical protein
MSMECLLALSLLLSTAAAPPPVRVDTAQSDWSFLPPLKHRGYDHLTPVRMHKIYELASSNRCDLPGESFRRIDLKISFAAQFDRSGKLVRLVLPRLNCPEGEGVLGGALLEMIEKGDYKPTGANPEGWYRGNLSFGYAG